MLRRNEPLGECQTIGPFARGQRRQYGKSARRHLLATAAEIATKVNVSWTALIRFDNRRGAGNWRERRLECCELVANLDGLKFIELRAVEFGFACEKIIQQPFALLRRALF